MSSPTMRIAALGALAVLALASCQPQAEGQPSPTAVKSEVPKGFRRAKVDLRKEESGVYTFYLPEEFSQRDVEDLYPRNQDGEEMTVLCAPASNQKSFAILDELWKYALADKKTIKFNGNDGLLQVQDLKVKNNGESRRFQSISVMTRSKDLITSVSMGGPLGELKKERTKEQLDELAEKLKVVATSIQFLK